VLDPPRALAEWLRSEDDISNLLTVNGAEATTYR